MRDYRKIRAWQVADQLALAIYDATRSFPREETFGLTSQLRRAAVSAPANLAEGSARMTKKDYHHFLHVARGSLAETDYLLNLSARLGYVGNERLTALTDLTQEARATLQALINAVAKEL